jgi:outer membrane protein TolC
MNRFFPRRQTNIGLMLVLIVALAAFFARTASAQQWTPTDTTVRLSLGEAVRLAAKQNASVEEARMRVDAAQARVTQKKSDLLPTVSAVVREMGTTINSATFPIDFPVAPGATPLFDPNGTILGPVNALDTRARLSQSLYDPAARKRVTSARTSVLATSADAGNVADVAATSAANAYLAVLRAASLVSIARDQLRAGTGIGLDVTRALSQLTGARTQLIVARNERDRTRIDLARALNLPPTNFELVDSLATLPANQRVNETASLEAAAHNRKDVQSLELQATAARQQADAIHGERLPSVGVFADQGWSQRNGRSYLPTYDWAIQLSVPIFDGFRREGRVAEQVSAARDLEIRARDLRAQVDADVRSATLNLRSSGEAVVAARERLSLAEQEVAQARERFQAGVSSNADVITASLTLNVARTQLVDAQTAYQASRVALARAQGSIATLD